MANNRVEVCDAFILNATSSLNLDQKPTDNEDSSSSCPSNSMDFDTPPSSRTSTPFNSPSVVEVWEDDEMIEFEFSPIHPETRFSTSTHQTKEKDQHEIDTLQGEYLPYFFSLTREERKMIRESVQRPSLARFECDEDFSDLWSYKP